MKICIVGAGAIGGFIGARLAHAAARSGVQVSALARGATLDALRTHGWRLSTQGALLQTPAVASDDPIALGKQDLVIVAVKGQALPAAAASIASLLHAQSIVLPAMNGVPWWFCHGLPGFGDTLLSVDPEGTISSKIPFSHVLGCVVHASTSCPEPGWVQHKMGQGLIVGEPLGGASGRVDRVAALLSGAGFEVTASPNVRYDIWYKLWGNLTMNPVSAITGATIDRVLGDPNVREFCSQTMREAAAIGERIGCAITQNPEDRHAITAKLGAFKTSMLQDVEAGRTIELDAIVGAVHEIGHVVGVKAPNVAALLGLTRLFAQSRGLYPKG